MMKSLTNAGTKLNNKKMKMANNRTKAKPMRNTNKTTRNHKDMEELAYQRSIKADKIRVIRERLQPTLNHLLRLFMTQQSDDTNEYHGYQITFDYALTT